MNNINLKINVYEEKNTVETKKILKIGSKNKIKLYITDGKGYIYNNFLFDVSINNESLDIVYNNDSIEFVIEEDKLTKEGLLFLDLKINNKYNSYENTITYVFLVKDISDDTFKEVNRNKYDTFIDLNKIIITDTEPADPKEGFLYFIFDDKKGSKIIYNNKKILGGIVGKEFLSEKIIEAQGLNESDYISGWSELQVALNKAIIVRDNDEATQGQIYTALINLNIAISNLISKYVMASDDDFSGERNGEFRYIGTDEYVEIPHVIKGVNVTSYQRMFENTSVKGVKSTNPNVIDMSYMFKGSQATILDLSSFNTENVTDMRCMFYNSQATILDLSSFNTENVIDMSWMFKLTSYFGFKQF